MARLVVMYGSRHTRTIALDVERLVIGRGKDADLSLKNQTISRMHCVVELAGNQHTLCDLDSTSGTFVNGDRIEGVHKLEHGDAIELGKHTLTYERDAIETGAVATPGAPADQDTSSSGFWEQGLAESGFGKAPPPESGPTGETPTPWDAGAVESAAEVTGKGKAVSSGSPEDYAGTMLASQEEMERIRQTLMVQQEPHLAVVVRGERKLVALKGDAILVGHYDEADFRLPGNRFFGRKQFKVFPSGTAWMIKVESFWAHVELKGKRLRGSELLRGGEVIKAGGYKFKFDMGDGP